MNLPLNLQLHPLPEKLVLQSEQLLCRWIYSGNHSFTEPFFSDTLSHLLSLEANHSRERIFSDLEEMCLLSSGVDYVEPSLFIFHVSRCGSTLISQLLSVDPAHIVLSEVPFLDDLLRLPYKKQMEAVLPDVNSLFGAALRFYGQKRTGIETKLFIKMDSWHLFFYHQLRKMYPDTPFVIIFRSPEEVMSSQHRRRGMHSVPGVIEPVVFGFTEKDMSFDFDLYMSKVLERYYEAILTIHKDDPSCLLVNYNGGIPPLLHSILEKASVHSSPSVQQKMNERLRYHSKSPHESYQADSVLSFPPGILTNCLDLYQQLEEKRLAVSPAPASSF
jgi:hypothetical protein